MNCLACRVPRLLSRPVGPSSRPLNLADLDTYSEAPPRALDSYPDCGCIQGPRMGDHAPNIGWGWVVDEAPAVMDRWDSPEFDGVTEGHRVSPPSLWTYTHNRLGETVRVRADDPAVTGAAAAVAAAPDLPDPWVAYWSFDADCVFYHDTTSGKTTQNVDKARAYVAVAAAPDPPLPWIKMWSAIRTTVSLPPPPLPMWALSPDLVGPGSTPCRHPMA